MSTRYGVSPAAFGDGIQVGMLSVDGTRFIDKEDDCTVMVLGAVARWVEQHYDGGAVVELGTKRIEITVTDLEAVAG